MSNDILKSGEDNSEPVGGERLRVARRANDISVRDVAKELHLDEAKVRALEKNDFALLGAPVFAKGHLRKYAELVGVSVEDVMADYYEMTRTAGVPPVIGPKRKRSRDFNAGPWLVAAVIILLVGAAAYWWFNLRPVETSRDMGPAMPAPFASQSRTPQPDRSPPDTASQPATQPASQLAGPPATQPVSQPTDRPAATQQQLPAAQAAPLQSDAAIATPAEPPIVVELTYSGECWTEASDATGRRLFYDLGVAGRTVRLSGVAPLRLILGDSGNVSISVDGRPYNIPASARSGRLARVTIGAR